MLLRLRKKTKNRINPESVMIAMCKKVFTPALSASGQKPGPLGGLPVYQV